MVCWVAALSNGIQNSPSKCSGFRPENTLSSTALSLSYFSLPMTGRLSTTMYVLSDVSSLGAFFSSSTSSVSSSDR